jgi:acetyl esterase
LGAALERMGVTCDTRYYAGEVHAFHAMVWRPAARRAWRDTFAFLDRFVP